MEKEDIKVLIHAGLAFVVILGGFALIEYYGGPVITTKIFTSDEIKSIDCVNTKIDDCCKLLEQADRCELLNTTNIADYVCYSEDNIEFYFSSDTYEYCS